MDMGLTLGSGRGMAMGDCDYWLDKVFAAMTGDERRGFDVALSELAAALADGETPPRLTPERMGSRRQAIHSTYSTAHRTEPRYWLGNDQHAIMTAVPQDPTSGYVFVAYDGEGNESARWALAG